MTDLERRIRRVRGLALRATFFRGLARRHGADALSMSGSLLAGGRYNPRGAFGALCLPSSTRLSRAERIKHAGGDPANLAPQAMGTVAVRLRRVLDLTRLSVLRKLGLRVAELTRPSDMSLPRRIAAAARAAGFEAILYPPALAEPGRNLAVFLDKLPTGSRIRLLGLHTERG